MGLKVFLIYILITGSAFAGSVEFEKAKVQSSIHNDVRFSVTTQHYKINFSPGKISWGTRMFAKYQTSSLDKIEDYAVVQFIRGCQFNQYIEGDKITFIDNILRDFFNELVTYKHPEWVIDSVDLDPMYNNTPEGFEKWNTRHGLYRWNRNNNFDQDSEVLYYKEKPTRSNLYVADRPGTAFFQDKMAKNISLEFKTCLYKTKDIPLKTTPSDLHFAKAVQCYDWNSSFIFDPKKAVFTRPSGIHGHCTAL